MSLNQRIKEARIKMGYTQEQLGNLIGVAKTTISGYEKNREPDAATIGLIIDALKVDANFLFQDEMKDFSAKDFTVSEIKMVKKYRLLDAHGKDMVDMVLEKELERTETVSQDEDSEYMELVARGGKYRVKKADVIKWVKQLDLDDYEEDHDLC